MHHVKFLDLSSQHARIRSELDAAVDDVLTHSSFIGGKWVQRFEQSWAEYVGAKHCIGVANGTDALEIALRAVNIAGMAHKNVIVPAFTAPQTAEAVVNAGYAPLFCDCGSDFLIDIEPGPKPDDVNAIVPVHLYGGACDMDTVLDVARSWAVPVVEDCAQAHGTRYQGQRVGTFGVAGVFSFYPSKNLGAMGDAGAIVTNSDDIASYCRVYADSGRSQKNVHVCVGRNSRLDALQAAILCVKLRYLDEWVAHRQEVAWFYLSYLPDLYEFATPLCGQEVFHSYHIYAVKTRRRTELQNFLSERGVETQVHYPVAVPDQSAYERYTDCTYPRARELANATLSLPMGPHVTEADVKYIAQCIREFYNA